MAVGLYKIIITDGFTDKTCEVPSKVDDESHFLNKGIADFGISKSKRANWSLKKRELLYWLGGSVENRPILNDTNTGIDNE